MAMRENQGNEAAGKFPVGMRVLAVDDNPVCVKILETLLRFCKYQPTMVRDGQTALQMLREKKDAFDLVISDVHMPDMDGFKLLEHIGLEMDLPVIMLSANEEQKTMMKGVTHGACDYLVKPVNVREAKNIWQHVVRKKKPDQRNHLSSGNDNVDQNVKRDNVDGEQAGAARTRKYKKRRKVEDDSDENKENPYYSAPKKPRVVWSSDLHKQFVKVVSHLGVDKAVPKKILEMMGVDYITRENVASHLQKYRLYLKRMHDYPTKRSIFVDPSIRWSSMTELENVRRYQEYGRYRSSLHIPSLNSNNPFARMNSPSALATNGFLRTQSGQSNMGIGTIDPQNSMNGGLPDAINISNGTMWDASSSFPSENSYAHILRNKLLETSKGFPSSLPCNSFGDIPNVGIFSPADQISVQSLDFGTPELGNQPSAQMNSSSGDLFSTLGGSSYHCPDLGNTSNSWQNAVLPNFPDLGHMDGTSLGSSQVNIPQINQLSSFSGSAADTNIFELQNKMTAFMSTTTPMADLDEQMAPFNMGSNTCSAEMMNGNFALGGAPPSINYSLPSASSFNSTSPDIQMDSSFVPPQMLNGGGAGGTLPVFDGIVNQQTIGDELNFNNDFPMGTNGSGGLDDFLDGLFNHDFMEGGGAFPDADWDFAV